MDNINISTTQEVDISLQADDIDFIVLNDGVTELKSAIGDIVSEDKLTEEIITAVGDAKYQPVGDYVTNPELNSKGYLTTIPEDYITEDELETKGYLTQHQPLKTVNGESLVGEGDIVIRGGNDGYTKEEADAKFQPAGEYYTKAESDEKYQPAGEYLTAIPDEYVTDSELDSKGYLTEHQALKTINGESLVGSGNITIGGGGGDMTNYYTKTEVNGLFDTVNVDLALTRTDVDWLINEINDNLKEI